MSRIIDHNFLCARATKYTRLSIFRVAFSRIALVRFTYPSKKNLVAGGKVGLDFSREIQPSW